MRIKPVNTLFNPERVLYELKNFTIFAKKGHGTFVVNKDGAIVIKKAKELGIYCAPGNNGSKMFIENSDINCLYENGNAFIKMHNCRFPSVPQGPQKHEHIVNVIYTNRP